MQKLKRIAKKLGVSVFAVMAVLAANVAVFAADTTGDADLDILMDQMTGGISTVKTGGLIIVGGVITIGIVFLGVRWLWNMFRSWLAKAQ